LAWPSDPFPKIATGQSGFILAASARRGLKARRLGQMLGLLGKHLLAPHTEPSRARKKQSSAIIAVDVRRFGHVIKKDEGLHHQYFRA